MTRYLSICCCSLALALVWTAGALAQSQTEKDRAVQQAINAVRAREIPEASLSSSTPEAEWWRELRAAGKAIRESRGAKKESDRFIKLIKDGLEKSYQAPIPNRGATVLWKAVPEYTAEARSKRIRGSVALAVELLPDGTVGEVTIAQSLDPGLDQIAVNVARKLVFLPMVKDRKFVSSMMPMTMSFDLY